LWVTLPCTFFASRGGRAAPASAPSSPGGPSAAESRVCAPREAAVYIQILGNRSWGWRLGRYEAIPAERAVIAVWSNGGPVSTFGVAAYGWTTRTRSAFFGGCSVGRAAAQPQGSLRAAVRVKDGWFYGRKYRCLEPGRFVVAISDTTGGKRITVRVQRTGKLLALGELTAGGGWLRGSKSCSESER
jgi:hypothetical protein